MEGEGKAYYEMFNANGNAIKLAFFIIGVDIGSLLI